MKKEPIIKKCSKCGKEAKYNFNLGGIEIFLCRECFKKIMKEGKNA